VTRKRQNGASRLARQNHVPLYIDDVARDRLAGRERDCGEFAAHVVLCAGLVDCGRSEEFAGGPILPGRTEELDLHPEAAGALPGEGALERFEAGAA